MDETWDPPFEATYKDLLGNLYLIKEKKFLEVPVADERELPVIDLSRLTLGVPEEERACRKDIARASREWGFFQVINHGISQEMLGEMREQQVKLFKKPFSDKRNVTGLNLSAGSYRWGTPSPTSVNQLSWSEAFHVSFSDISDSSYPINTLSSTMEEIATAVSELGHKLAEILAEEIGRIPGFFKKTCLPNTSYIRLNRYPKCHLHAQIYGIVPHTDSDFLTVVHQDTVGGLQLVKDGSWIDVKPNPDALIVNIGDLFQAWSNNVYKSVEHRVISNESKERFSMAYFLCPSYETIINCDDDKPSVYRSFSFGEYRKKVQEDVQIIGHKIGLPRFISNSYM